MIAKPRLQIIDVSGHQSKVKPIDWSLVKPWVDPTTGEQLKAAIAKASEGHGWADPSFKHNWKNIESCGLARGAYHYARPDTIRKNDARDEASWFVDQLTDFDSGKDIACLDIEDARDIAPGLLFTNWVLDFRDRVDELTGQRTIIYTGGPFFDLNDGSPSQEVMDRIALSPLWLAAYVQGSPDRYIPPEWRKVGWTIHQYSGDAPNQGGVFPRIDGILSNVDRNVFRGSEQDYDSWVESLVLRHPTIQPPPFHFDGPANPLGYETWAEIDLKKIEEAGGALPDEYRSISNTPTDPQTPVALRPKKDESDGRG